MSKIETGRYAERLRRSLGMKGVEEVAPALSAEISPVIVIEDNSAEWQFLQAVRIAGAGTLVTGVALQTSVLHFLNPAGSGVIVVFTHLDYRLNKDARTNFGYATSATPRPTVQASAIYDHRWATSPNPTTVRLTSDTGAGVISLSSTIFVTQVPNNVNYSWNGTIVLLPGEALEFGSADDDTDMMVNTRWTERALSALEQ